MVQLRIRPEKDFMKKCEELKQEVEYQKKYLRSVSRKREKAEKSHLRPQKGYGGNCQLYWTERLLTNSPKQYTSQRDTVRHNALWLQFSVNVKDWMLLCLIVQHRHWKCCVEKVLCECPVLILVRVHQLSIVKYIGIYKFNFFYSLPGIFLTKNCRMIWRLTLSVSLLYLLLVLHNICSVILYNLFSNK